MDTIIINNDYSFLKTNNAKILDFLHKHLRFRQKNYFHNQRYRMKLWDGFINFFNKDNGKFLTGLLPEVQATLSHFKTQYIIQDERKDLEFSIKSIDDNFLNYGPKPLILHDYQVDLVNSALKNKRCTVQAPTASGKSAILISILKCLPENTPAILLGNRKGIIDQNYKEMIFWGLAAGKFDGTTKNQQLITCATVQSLHHLEKVLPSFKVLVVDEVHTMINNSALKAYKKLKNCSIRIAVSATPFKDGESDLVQKYSVKGFFGPILKTKVTDSGKLTTKFLQEQGKLSKSICNFHYVKEPQIPYDLYLDAITNGVANNPHFHKLVCSLVEKLEGRTLILVERVEHGDTLQKMIPNSLWIYGKDDLETRNEVIEKLKYSKDNVVAIATTGIFNAGINCFIKNLINAASGQADHEIIQRMGRGLRVAEDKEILNYYDFIFTINPYLEKHSKKRIRILKKEGHEIIIHD